MSRWIHESNGRYFLNIKTMAKSIGLVGTLSGKSGNFVFCKGADGRTIVRPYQPQVYNPKTAAQSGQRSKMVLAGQLSSMASSALLVSMNMGRKVANRSAFVRNILRKADYDHESTNYVSSIFAEDIVFGRGSVAPHFDASGEIVQGAAGGKVTCQYQPVGITADMVNRVGIRTIVLCARKEGQNQVFQSIEYTDALFTSTNNPLDVDVQIPSAVVDSTYYAVYAVPFELSEEGAAQFGDGGYANAQAISAVLRTTNSVVKDWGDSRLVSDFTLYVGE